MCTWGRQHIGLAHLICLNRHIKLLSTTKSVYKRQIFEAYALGEACGFWRSSARSTGTPLPAFDSLRSWPICTTSSHSKNTRKFLNASSYSALPIVFLLTKPKGVLDLQKSMFDRPTLAERLNTVGEPEGAYRL